MPPRPRKGHNKSRTGCGNCKRRKIKCNESKPECTNCVKHRIQCDYLDSAPAAEASQSCSPSTSPPLVSEPVTQQPSLPLNNVDLELMHNFITSTSQTMSTIPEVRNLWRLEIPRIAFRCDFVLRALLAVSALHTSQSKSDPEEREFYVEFALEQHRISLREPMNMLHKPSPESASALLVYSILTSVLALATPRKPGDFLIVGNEGVTNWLFLLRGSSSIVNIFREQILSEPIGVLIHKANVPPLREELSAPSPVAEEKQFADLRRFLQNDIADPEELRIYLEATDKLSRTFAYFARGNGAIDNEIRCTFLWIHTISDAYLALLTQYKPHAMIIFAYYSTLLHRLDSHWWVKGWGTHLIALIYRQLDSYYHPLLRWPIEEIGWVPTYMMDFLL